MMETRPLSPDGEEAAAGRVHEDELVSVTCARSIRVNSEKELALGVVDGEAITGEEERSLSNCEMCLFFVDEAVSNCDCCSHFFNIKGSEEIPEFLFRF